VRDGLKAVPYDYDVLLTPNSYGAVPPGAFGRLRRFASSS